MERNIFVLSCRRDPTPDKRNKMDGWIVMLCENQILVCSVDKSEHEAVNVHHRWLVADSYLEDGSTAMLWLHLGLAVCQPVY